MLGARWSVTDEEALRAKMELWAEEDRKIIKSIALAGTPEGSLMVFEEKANGGLDEAFAAVEKIDVGPRTFIVPSSQMAGTLGRKIAFRDGRTYVGEDRFLVLVPEGCLWAIAEEPEQWK